MFGKLQKFSENVWKCLFGLQTIFGESSEIGWKSNWFVQAGILLRTAMS